MWETYSKRNGDSANTLSQMPRAGKATARPRAKAGTAHAARARADILRDKKSTKLWRARSTENQLSSEEPSINRHCRQLATR